MDKGEFLLLIPGLIYGVGLVDLLKIFRSGIYWEISVMAVFLFVNLIINWFLFFERLQIVSDDIAVFTLTMISPMLFTRACVVLTPEYEVEDTKHYFEGIRKIFFLLLGSQTVVNIIIEQVVHDDGFNFIRILGAIILFLCAYYDKLWLRIIMMIVYALSILYIFHKLP